MKVLIVDDTPANLRLLRAVLEGESFEVVEATDGAQGLAVLEREPVDAVISDILMPNMDGYRFCNEVRRNERLHHLPFIIYSSTYNSPTDAKLALDMGADKYIKKPAPVREIAAALDEIMRRGPRTPPAPRPPQKESSLAKLYNETLVNKLKQKNDELSEQTEALRVSEEKFRQLAENINEVCFILSADLSETLYINPAYEKIWGRTCQSVRKSSVTYLDGIHEADRPRAVAALEGMKRGEKYDVEYRVVRPDGQIRNVHARGSAIRNEAGAIYRLAGIAEDITQRKQAEAELLAAHSQLHQLLDHSPVILYALKVEGQNVAPYLISENIADLLGFTVAEALHYEWWLGQLHPEDRERAVASISETLTKGASLTEYRVRHKDGSYRWVEDTRRLVRDASNQPVEIVGIWADITERKRAEEVLLKTSRQKVGRQQTGMVKELIVIFTICAVSAAFFYYTDVLVAPLDALVAKFKGNIDDLLGPPAILVLGLSIFSYRRWRDVNNQVSEHVNIEEALRTLHGELETRVQQRTAELTKTNDALRLEIIERKKAEEERQKLEDQFRQAQKMEAVGQLAGGVAHDFNNLLTIIGGNLELMMMVDNTLQPASREYLKDIATATERATTLTRQLLAFSRSEAMQMQVLNLNTLVENFAKLIHRILGEDIRIKSEFAQKLPPIKGDPGMIEQILMNLAVNARDAMPAGGQITISTELKVIDAASAAQNPRVRPGHFACLTVQDTGTGIAPENMSRIFEPFFTTKGVGKGTGLGLATVFGIAQQHGGWVDVSSQINVGTTFRVFLPVTAETIVTPDTTVRKKARGGGEKILVVEDEKAVRNVMTEILQRQGYVVVEADSGVSARQIWAAEGRDVALLLTDMVMPGGLTGLELAELLRQQKPGLKVVLTSGYSSQLVSSDVLSSKKLSFLKKPFSTQSLAETVRKSLDEPC